jgi:hypothetical protein
MKIRAIERNDLTELQRIHSLFYKDEFEFPDFFKNFLCVFVIEDDNGEIITAGGVRCIAESILITNKDKSARDRIPALYDALQISNYICTHNGYNQLHAFIQDNKWLKQLLKSGFRNTKGQSVVIDI